MNSVICTLFEGNYHLGLAALINSLHKYGYKGDIFAGYRGALPPWCASGKKTRLNWDGATTLQVANDLQLYLLPIETNYHFTNFKPNFMLQILDVCADEVPGIVYFDPDIVVKCNWEFYELWLTHGVALVHEIINHDMPPNHPLRAEWAKVVVRAGKTVRRELRSYINGGFCGVSKQNIEFLHIWQKISDTAMAHFALTADQWSHDYDRTHIFFKQDQDVLNIAAMCAESTLSEMGPEGMDFVYGGFTMSHAVGSPKPWKKNFFLSMLKGRPPTMAERIYWGHVTNPIKVFWGFKLFIKKISILIAGFAGRFYRRY